MLFVWMPLSNSYQTGSLTVKGEKIHLKKTAFFGCFIAISLKHLAVDLLREYESNIYSTHINYALITVRIGQQ